MRTTFTAVAQVLLCSALLAGSASLAAAQSVDTVVKAKALYAEASYAEALEALGPSEGAEAHQYRALCYLALGKIPEAERSLEALVNVAPSYTVSEAELPPRLVTLFTQTRRRVMPAVARRIFAEARDEFQARQYEQARTKFEQVLELTRDPAMAGASEGSDLQVLSASYLDIVKTALAPPPAATPAVAAAPAPATVPQPTTSPAPTSIAAASPTAGKTVAPEKTSASVPPVLPPQSTIPPAPAVIPLATLAASLAAGSAAAPRSTVILPAVTVRQDVPSYIAASGAPPRVVSGAVRVIIGVDGKVKAASMDTPVDARYDARVLAAARNWLYKPATRGGEPIESEKVIAIHIGAK